MLISMGLPFSSKAPKAVQARRTPRLSGDGARDLLRSVAFLTPSVLGVAVFFILPFLVVVYYSVIRSPMNPEFVFLDNFKMVLENNSFRVAAKNTAMFSAIAVPLAVVLSLALALLLECRIPAKSLLRTFFLSPMMVPVASVVLIWQVVFHYRGTLNVIVERFGAHHPSTSFPKMSSTLNSSAISATITSAISTAAEDIF